MSEMMVAVQNILSQPATCVLTGRLTSRHVEGAGLAKPQMCPGGHPLATAAADPSPAAADSEKQSPAATAGVLRSNNDGRIYGGHWRGMHTTGYTQVATARS